MKSCSVILLLSILFFRFTDTVSAALPGLPTNPSPAGAATGIDINADISWTAGTGATSHDVYFGTVTTPPFIINQAVATFAPGTLAAGKTYYWRIDERNIVGATMGSLWRFTTLSLPGKAGGSNPSSPSSPPYTILVDVTKKPTWFAGIGATSHDVYFGTNPAPAAAEFKGNQTTTTYNIIGNMMYNTTYFWRIDERNASGVTTGDIWRFTTHARAYSPNPANEATGISVTSDLNWKAGTGVSGEIGSYNVYFGSANPPPFVANLTNVTNAVDVNYELPTMDYDTKYYWQIDTITPFGRVITGDVCSFTTAPPPPGKATDPDLPDGTADVSQESLVIRWTTGAFTTSHNIYFGATPILGMAEFRGNSLSAGYGTGVLNCGTTYYWRIDEVGAGGITAGEVWSFTATAEPPQKATGPNPADNTTCVAPGISLSWSVSPNTATCNVYFGSINPPDYALTTNSNVYNPTVLSSGTPYYWKVDTKNVCGITAGDIWQFTTASKFMAWGNHEHGECDIPLDIDPKAISAGFVHGLALKVDGSLVAWGYNGQGQCDVPAGNDFIAIAAGAYHSLALKSDGSLAAWGSNSYGQCNVPSGNDFIAIAAGCNHGVALKSNGLLVAWGLNNIGQCDVPSGNDFIAIAASNGGSNSLALKSDGSLAAWGSNGYGQCNVPIGNDFTAIAVGKSHCLALKSDSSLAAWGYNGHGQCDVPSGNDYVKISGGGNHSLALKLNGSIVAWGSNYFGQCNVPDGTDFVAVAAGDAYSIAIGGQTPFKAVNPSPANLAVEVDITADLTWAEGDLAVSHDVYFGTTNPPEFQMNTTNNTFLPSTLSPSTVYYWRIDEKNAAGTTTGDIWSFTTVPPPPGEATNLSPFNSDCMTDTTIVLSWTAGTNATSHDVYFGSTNQPPFLANLPITTYQLPSLLPATMYYWRIDAKNAGGTTTGDVWSFTVKTGKASNPIPANGGVNVDANADLSWTAGTGTASLDVYFGTVNPPLFVANVLPVNYEPPTMNYSTKYYWRVDEKVGNCTTTGDIWSFTTCQPTVPDLKGLARTLAQTTLTQLGLNFDVVYQRDYSVSGDCVISQNPAAGTIVPVGTIIHLIVSLTDVDFTVQHIGSDKITIGYFVKNGVEIRSVALRMLLSSATVNSAADVISVDPAFNGFVDYAFSTGAGYTLGSGNPLADYSVSGVPIFGTNGISTFSVNMASFDTSGGKKPAPAASSNLVTLQLRRKSGASEILVVISEDAQRSSWKRKGIVTNLPVSLSIE